MAVQSVSSGNRDFMCLPCVHPFPCAPPARYTMTLPQCRACPPHRSPRAFCLATCIFVSRSLRSVAVSNLKSVYLSLYRSTTGLRTPFLFPAGRPIANTHPHAAHPPLPEGEGPGVRAVIAARDDGRCDGGGQGLGKAPPDFLLARVRCRGLASGYGRLLTGPVADGSNRGMTCARAGSGQRPV